MTFVIKAGLEQENAMDINHNKFDPVPYYYLFNKSSSFMDANLIGNHTKLECILSELHKKDPNYLEILNYS